MDSKVTLIHWFRKGLRVHDNPGLKHIFDLAKDDASKYSVRPIFILDPEIQKWVRTGINRWRFLQQSLQDLNTQLQALNSRLYVIRGNPTAVFPRIFVDWKQVGCVTVEADIDPYARHYDSMLERLAEEHSIKPEDLNTQLQALNSRLYVIRGNPTAVFPRIFVDWKQVGCVTVEADIDPYARHYDSMLERLAEEHSIKVLKFYSHTIYTPEVVLRKNMGKAPLTYQKFLSLIEELKVPTPLKKPEKLLTDAHPVIDVMEGEDPSCYDCPTLKELVQNLEDFGDNKFPGGESEALRRLEYSLRDEQWVCSFEKPNTAPNSLEPSTTVLSPYLSFGCLSARLFHQRLTDCLKRHAKHTQPPVSLMGQLLWREFYYTVAAAEPSFGRMMGNVYCLQIPWQTNDVYLDAWTHGRTGYPFIDAIMRQLRQEGWIHHLARHAVACFLTRGDLWISWEEGQNVFEELLLDQDWALNAGNWMWLSASAFFHKYFRVYSPVAFGKKTDPQGFYIRKYVPELAKYPAKYLYEPWKATLQEQRDYGCILGENYPQRIVHHEVVHKENIKKMTAAYKVNREVRTGRIEETPDAIERGSGDKRKAKRNSATTRVSKKHKSAK